MSTAEAPLRKKSTPTFKSRMALLELIDRKRLEDRPGFKLIADKHGISCGSLRNLWVKFQKGEIEFGRGETPEERRSSAKIEHEKQLELCQRHQAFLIRCYELALYKAEDLLMKTKDPLAGQKIGLPKLAKELVVVNDLIAATEKGYCAVLDEYRASLSRPEKDVNGRPITDIETKITRADDEQKALAALRADAEREGSMSDEERGLRALRESEGEPPDDQSTTPAAVPQPA